ncbi:MAG: PfaB family protein [Anaerolineales bacterium]
MNLKVSGISLSLQWTPSLKQAEFCLTGSYQPLPSLVEHPGEVILKALRGIPRKSESRLTHIHLGAEAELGHYTSLLEEQFLSVKQFVPETPQIAQVIRLAATAVIDCDSQVLISETTKSGTAAVVLSHLDSDVPGIAIISPWTANGPDQPRAEYIGIASPPDLRNLSTLAELTAGKDSYPIALGSFNAPRFGYEALPVLIQTILAVKNRIIPAWHAGNSAPELGTGLQNLQISTQSRPWLSGGPGFKRRAIFAQLNPGTPDWDLLSIEELPGDPGPCGIRVIPGKDPVLIPLTGDQPDEVLHHLDSLEVNIKEPGSLKKIADNAYAKYLQKKGTFTCCLLGKDREQLENEISHARSGIIKAFETGQPWNSPAGSYFTSQPLGNGGIAFVYPGAFNSYPGMGRELFFSFPGLFDLAQQIIPDLRHSLAEDFLYLGGPDHDLDLSEDQLIDEFYRHPTQLIESGISLSALYTILLKDVFNLTPDAALGYSLGEISMLWANRVWQNAQDSSDRWKNSHLYTDQLVGEMKIVREFWKNEVLAPDFWDSYILKADSQQVEVICDQEPLAFLTIRNTPEEVVIAGEKEACQRVISKLGCRALPMPFNTAIHNPAVAASYPDFLELYSNPTTPRDGIRFYSAADYQVLRLSKENLAQSMARMTTSPIDFSRLVNQVYDSGVRIFVEVGPQKTCSRWIERILDGKPHAVIPINKKYQGDFLGILKAISLLISQGVELDLHSLYDHQDTAPADNPSPVQSEREKGSSAGGRTLAASPATTGGLNAAYFQNLNLLAEGMARSHQIYLTEQHKVTKSILKAIVNQKGLSDQPLNAQNQDALYTRRQIQAFTIGDPKACFGDLFQGFHQQRIPRLPNGPLQFLDRVIQIDGHLGEVRPGSSLVSEFDTPADSWFRDGKAEILPHVALMEIALQPCGFLSAYMGSILGREGQDLYFRNLDGEATLLNRPFDPNQPITNQVELLSSSSLGDVIIQKYQFELSQEGQPFFKGSSSFGYFTPQMLKNQNGLDGNQDRQPWQEQNPDAGRWMDLRRTSIPLNGTPVLPSVDHAWVAHQGGEHQKGYLLLNQSIPENSWFYSAHFHQDPVMPGSLGVETMAAAVRSAASQWGIPENLGWQMAGNTRLTWKYRGQITPNIRNITVDLHIKSIIKKGPGWEITVDGQLWKGSKRIYLVENLCLESYPILQESGK